MKSRNHKQTSTGSAKPDGLIPVVGYIRMSTDMQTDSPERQRAEIEEMAKRDSKKILRWYEDRGISGTKSNNRPAFQEMMQAAQNCEFKEILLYELSRFSREDVLEVVSHWKTLRDCGVRLFTVQTGEIKFDDLGGIITSVVAQYGARSESIKFAQRSMSGRKMKAKNGIQMGQPPFGYDRLIYDDKGNLFRRVKSSEKFKRPNNFTSRLAPTEDEAIIDAIKFAYDTILDGGSTRAVVRELRRRGIRSRKGNLLNQCAVQDILRNPVYMGVYRYNHDNSAAVFTDKNEETIFVSGAHPAIISPEKFQDVQTILGSNSSGIKDAMGNKYLLRGMVRCCFCFQKMFGQTLKRPGRADMRRYTCGFVDCSNRLSISADVLEKMVLHFVSEILLSDNNLELLQAAEEENLVALQGEPLEDLQLRDLRRNINRAEQNLALAEANEDFKAISKLLEVWRSKEESIIKKRRGLSRPASAAIQKAFLISKTLDRARSDLLRADRTELHHALRATIERVEIGRIVDRSSYPVRQIRGILTFKSDVFDGDPIEFDEHDVYPDKTYLDVAEFVKRSNRPVTTAEIASHFGFKRQVTWSYAHRAAMAGLLSENKTRGRATLFSAALSNG